MNIDEVITFLKVDYYGKINIAADELHISQSAASRRITALEQYLGYSLFLRSKGSKSMTLTEKGKEFRLIAQKYFDFCNAAKKIGTSNVEKVLRVCSMESINYSIMKPVYAVFMAKYPDISLEVSTLYPDQCFKNINENLADIAIVPCLNTDKRLETSVLYKEPIVFISSKVSSFNNIVYPQELDYSKYIKFDLGECMDPYYKEWYGENKSVPAFKTDTVIQLKYAFDYYAQGKNWSLIPAAMANELVDTANISIHQITPAPPERILYLITKKQLKNINQIRFFELLKTQFNV